MKLVNWQDGEVPVRDLCSLWKRTFGYSFPLSERLFLQNSVNCPHVFSKGSWYVEENEQIVGFVVSKVTAEREDLLPTGVGWIQVLMVDPNHQNKGYGTVLLEKAEQALQSASVSKIALGSDINHYFPGIPSALNTTMEWFEKNGYTRGNTENDYVQSYEQPPKAPTPNKISFTVLREEEKDDLLAFLSRCFPGRWYYEAWDYFRAGGQGEHFLVAKDNQTIIGFVRVNDWDSPIIGPNVYWKDAFEDQTMGIGPLGIDPTYRKKGYGKAMVEHAIQTAYERGARNIIIDWTDLKGFYESFGFHKWKSYHQYKKNI